MNSNKNYHHISLISEFPEWGYVCLGTIGIILIIIFSFLYVDSRKQKQNNQSSSNSQEPSLTYQSFSNSRLKKQIFKFVKSDFSFWCFPKQNSLLEIRQKFQDEETDNILFQILKENPEIRYDGTYFTFDCNFNLICFLKRIFSLSIIFFLFVIIYRLLFKFWIKRQAHQIIRFLKNSQGFHRSNDFQVRQFLYWNKIVKEVEKFHDVEVYQTSKGRIWRIQNSQPN